MELTIEGLEKDTGIGDIKEGNKILFRGEPGTLKSTLAYYLVWNACSNEKKALYLLFEESKKVFSDHLNNMQIDTSKKEMNGSLILKTFTVFSSNNGLSTDNGYTIIDFKERIKEEVLSYQNFLKNFESFVKLRARTTSHRSRYAIGVFAIDWWHARRARFG